jgi:SAM-dependent methyltransferase
MENLWDHRYSEPGFAYGEEPNVLFKREIDRREPGSLLLPGEGEGRNAVYAARRGWEVTAFDQSAVARKKALEWAERENLEINYQQADLADYNCGGKFDMVAVIYIHLPPQVRTAVHHRLLECLHPGGSFIMECFHADQLSYGTGGPPVRELLYTTEDLLTDFRGLSIKKCENIILELNEGTYHSGQSSVIQLIAKK